MSEPMSFSVKGILPVHTAAKSSQDPIGSDIVKITEEFVKLLIAQVSNQDPDKPLDPTEMITQYSQMIATMGSIKLSNSVNHFEQVKLAEQLIGRTVTWLPQIDYSKIVYEKDPITGEMVRDADGDLIVKSGLPIDPITGKPSFNPIPITDVITGTDFSTDVPKVLMSGQATPIPVSEISNIYNGPASATQNVSTAANVVGKTVRYVDPANPSSTLTGIVTSVDFTTSMPTLQITGQTVPIPIGAVSTIFN